MDTAHWNRHYPEMERVIDSAPFSQVFEYSLDKARSSVR
jgi:hypothetical protein